MQVRGSMIELIIGAVIFVLGGVTGTLFVGKPIGYNQGYTNGYIIGIKNAPKTIYIINNNDMESTSYITTHQNSSQMSVQGTITTVITEIYPNYFMTNSITNMNLNDFTNFMSTLNTNTNSHLVTTNINRIVSNSFDVDNFLTEQTN